MIRIAPPVSTCIPMSMLPALVMEEEAEVYVFSDDEPSTMVGLYVLVRAERELSVTEYALRHGLVVRVRDTATEVSKNVAWVLKQHVDAFRKYQQHVEAFRKRRKMQAYRSDMDLVAKDGALTKEGKMLFFNTTYGVLGLQKDPPLDQSHLMLPDGSQALMDHTKQEAQRLGLRVSSDPPAAPCWEADYCTEDAWQTQELAARAVSPTPLPKTFTPKNLIDVQTYIRTALAEGQPIPREWLDRALSALDVLFYTGDELLRRAHAERYGVPLEQVGLKKRFRYTPSAAEEKRIDDALHEAVRTLARGRGVDAERFKFGKAHGLAVECYVEQFVRPDVVLADANVWLVVYWELDKSSLVVDGSENAVTKLGLELWMETLEGTTHPEVIGERACRRDADGAEFWMEPEADHFSSYPAAMIAKDLAAKSIEYVSAYPAEMLAKSAAKGSAEWSVDGEIWRPVMLRKNENDE